MLGSGYLAQRLKQVFGIDIDTVQAKHAVCQIDSNVDYPFSVTDWS